MSKFPYWIKERHNPQLGIYYVGMGQLSKTAAKKCEEALYGTNYMQSYSNEADYRLKLDELKAEGKKVQ